MRPPHADTEAVVLYLLEYQKTRPFESSTQARRWINTQVSAGRLRNEGGQGRGNARYDLRQLDQLLREVPTRRRGPA
ncbi:hypothetical protein STTU_0767 [Streptomyces sp. Tu6071]|uniref:hypothetical protein n=1 Tax=Streptomyces sp. Tu6071 TaxID=355249 RepID=UPI00020E53F1|nr:hypothetical protein [Streptomyces sp. Tu6071]EGJ73557.1 hypothetical protein STTU_0767 [Streptomyces sp. Tu6071]